MQMSELLALQTEAGRLDVLLKQRLRDVGGYARLKHWPKTPKEVDELHCELQSALDELYATLPVHQHAWKEYLSALAKWQAEADKKSKAEKHARIRIGQA